ncbi:hypothetical protein OAM18_05000 [Candidatus Pelagibacter sp.]|jgi:hypothetical protein|nr:hypothetical protein [Candidatus Pelagibacter sp.]
MINIKRSLYAIVIFSFLFQVIKFYTFYQEYSAWQYADWIINYQGGFVRRGLIGEILFNVHKIFSIRLDLVTLLFVTSLFTSLSYFLIKSLKYLENSKLDILIFLSPGFVIYPIMNSEVIGRKDILITLAIAFLVFFEKNFKSKNLLILLISSISLISLSHSGLLFYTPYLVFLFFLIKINRNEVISFKDILFILSSLFIILFLIFLNQGTVTQVEEICQSIKQFVIEDCKNSGQFLWLSTPANEHMNFKLSTNYNSYTIIYLLSLFLVNLFLGIKLYLSKFKTNHFNLNKINPLIILFSLFLFTLPIYILGFDWGRYISMSYSCTFFIYIFCKKNDLFIKYSKNKIGIKSFSKFFFLLFVLIYCFSWTFPFYDAQQFKYPLKKPFISITKQFIKINK